MAEMKKKGRCWKGYKPVPGKKAYSKGSCAPVGKVKKEENGGYGELGGEPSDQGNGNFPSNKKILSANDNARAKKARANGATPANDNARVRKESKLKEIKATPTPAARKKNPNARANDPANRAAAIQGRLSARVQSREDYPEGSPLRSGGSSKQDKNRASKLSKISGIEENDARAAYKNDDSDARAHDTFDRAEPFERRPYSHNSASTADKHSFARDQGDSSRQPKKKRGSKESERSQNNRRKYLKSMLRRKRSNG